MSFFFLNRCFHWIVLQFLLRCTSRFLFRYDLSYYRGCKVLECHENNYISLNTCTWKSIHLRKEVNIHYKLFHLFTHNTQRKPQTHALVNLRLQWRKSWFCLFGDCFFFSYMYDECIYLKAEKVYYAPNHMEYATLNFIITIIYCWGKMKY